MRTRHVLSVLLVAVLCGVVVTSATANIKQVPFKQLPSDAKLLSNRFIVVLNEDAVRFDATDYRNFGVSGVKTFDRLAARFNVDYMRPQFVGAAQRGLNKLSRYYKVEFSGPQDLETVMAAYEADPNVHHVEPIGVHPVYATPNDGYFSYQWYHTQTSDHDIDSPEAWDIQTGSDNLIIALLDSGVRYYHPDLGGVNASPSNPGASRGNMWINTAELNGSSGVDDDGNGYTDDWIGYDFVDNASNCWSGEDCDTKDNDPRDFNGHGTHTAGIIGMMTNDGYGMAGTAGGWGPGSQTEYGNGVKVMALRMGYSYDYFGQEYGVVLMDAAAEAFYYAADNGAKIASCSWGSSNSGGIGAAADYFINNGGIIVVAAGNGGAEEAPDYLNGRGDCISVAATDENDNGAGFTTYGTWVDICAPGDNIYSTYHDHTDPNTNYWASMGGTSMATPMTAAVCGLIWSQNPTWSAAQVENQLYTSSDNIDAYLSSQYIGKMGAGRINSYNAVNTGTPPPSAAFSGSPTSGCAPLTVNFTDESTGDITAWDWDFGDGGSSTAQNPSHEYTSGGTYTVALTVTGPGGSDTETKTNYITVNVAPTTDFVGSPTSGTEPLTVDFTDQSTNNPTSWDWDFGDGGTSTAQNPSHEYTAAGTYTVTLTATNACGSDIETKTDYITVDPCLAPVADFSGSPTSGDYPLMVNFTDLSTNSPTSWDWDFGDGGTSTAQNPSHEYTAAGTYTVTLTATNACGSDVETKTDYITVTEPPCDPPVADFSGSPTSGDYPLTVNFTDLSTNSPTSWDWDFGDGGTSTAQNPSHEYTAAGTYTVSLTATNSCGSDTETKTDYITVTEPTVDYATLPYNTGFESGTFDQYWYTVEGTEGRILITTANTPHSGSYHMTMDDHTNGGSYSQNEAWLRLNLSGNTNVDLIFWWKEFSDEDHTQDGVFFSDDGGSSFVKVYNLTGGSATWQEISLDVDALAGSNGLTLTSTFVVKFQQYDNYGITTDGMAFDDIKVVSADVPPVADFVGSPTSGSAPLTVNFTDQSSGNPTSWSWDFGDGGTSTVQNPLHEYTDVGTYTVSLTASNAFGSDVETKTDYITVTEPSQNTMYVQDITVWRQSFWYWARGYATVTIYDNSGSPLSNATVYGTMTGPTGGNVNGTTNSSGEVTFVTGWTTASGEWCFEVTDVTHGTYTYDPGSNVVTKACESGPVYAIGAGPLIRSADNVPEEFGVLQNYPNPFNAETNIEFALPENAHVTLDVYNVLGQQVRTLVDEMMPAGWHTIHFDARNEYGQELSSGIYLYRLQAGTAVETKKMLLMK